MNAPNPKILFLRVGIDRGCGGTLSPRFPDGTFEFVPIPEFADVIQGRGVTYLDLEGRYGGTLDFYSGSSGMTHYDPEFETFSYGEPNEPKRSQLLRLASGDYLVFYAGFQGDGIEKGTCFIVGYFYVNAVHRVSDDESWPPNSLAHLHNNAHFRRKNPEPTLVVVEGNLTRSQLFKVGIQLSDEHQVVLPSVQDVIGFGGSVKRAIGRWVPESYVKTTIQFLTTPPSFCERN